MTEVAVIVPVLARPQAAQPLADSLHAATVVSHRLVFVCSPDDRAEIHACKSTGADVVVVDWQPGHGDWSKKINAVYAASDEPYLFLGADDLRFQPQWDVAALDVAVEGWGVVGTDDLGNPTVRRGLHSTHPLVSRAYIDACGTIDECGKVLCEAYRHNWVDVELVETARQRGAWRFCPESRVQHLHPFWKTAADDATYRAGREHYAADGRLYQERRLLWEAVAA